MEMLNNNNCLAQAFRMARDRIKDPKSPNREMRLLSTRQPQNKQYNLPTTSEVAALVATDFGFTDSGRDIIVEHKREGCKRISELHPSFMALQYPLLFPYGEDGYHPNIRYNSDTKRKKIARQYVTMREYYAYSLQQRINQGHTLLLGGRLFQQYVVDAYATIETERLSWVRSNQQVIRTELHKNIYDAVHRGDTNSRAIGKRVILPPYFTGGPRYMANNYQDAMAICRWYGNPDIFLTFTANTKWPEISNMLNLIEGQKAEDRPDIVSRVFNLKLQQPMKVLIKEQHFGEVRADIFTIEFQKRGLPHAHILLWLEPRNRDANFINKIISAEIPNKETDQQCYDLVTLFMIHGPCGNLNKGSPCMSGDVCTKKFPKSYQQETTIDGNGYAVYRRRSNDRNVKKGKSLLDNGFVVPYNRELLLKFRAHINVEWCNKAKAIKYLFKYLSKGSDRTTLVIKNKSKKNKEGVHPEEEDEIENYLDCRYLSASEATWRIFQFEIHHRDPAVVRLYIHLPREQPVSLRENQNIVNIAASYEGKDTIFTEWLKANGLYAQARNLTYAEFPSKFVWHEDKKIWTPRKKGRCLGRIVYVHPTSGERYYLRLLLNSAKGPQSYEEIRTINGITYPTFKEACSVLGLLKDDKEWNDAIIEANVWATPQQLRELFVTILLFCDVSDPLQFWESSSTMLCEDIELKRRKLYRHPNLQLSEEQIRSYCLIEIEKVLSRSGKTLSDYLTMPEPKTIEISYLDNNLIRDELTYDLCELKKSHDEAKLMLNEHQAHIYGSVIEAVENKDGGVFFVYGPGGTGKTFLHTTIASKLRSERKIVLTVASSGIASLLLPGGRTAHSRFDIPVELFDGVKCGVRRQTQLAKLLLKAELIIWDEEPMDHRFAFEVVDKTFRDIMDFEKQDANHKPFGGKVILMGGDFRQVLPVIPKGKRQDVVQATLNRSYIWDDCRVFTLTRSMRVQTQTIAGLVDTDKREFNKWLLEIGNGTAKTITRYEEEEPTWVEIPDKYLIAAKDNPVKELVTTVYPDFLQNCTNESYLREGQYRRL